jgi:hypothetical protein
MGWPSMFENIQERAFENECRKPKTFELATSPDPPATLPSRRRTLTLVRTERAGRISFSRVSMEWTSPNQGPIASY